MTIQNTTIALITNPDDASHRMWLRPIQKRISIHAGGACLARSNAALRLIEIGATAYEPVVYLPCADVKVSMIPRTQHTYCPLKGEAAYFDVELDGTGRLESLAWAYPNPRPFATALAALVAFDPARVEIIESPWAEQGP